MLGGLRARIFVAAAVLATVVFVGVGAALTPVVRSAVGDGDRGAATAAVVVALAVGAAVTVAGMALVASRAVRPVHRLRRAVRARIAGTEAGAIPLEGPEEFDELARTFNDMTAMLRQQLDAVAVERGRLEQTLAAAADVVIAVDADARIVYANDAAEPVLAMPAHEAVGRPLLSALVDHQVHDLVQAALRREGPRPAVIRRDDRFFQVIANRIEGGRLWAAVAVLQDVTALQEAEAARRELVANISHELRTPIASILAAIETLETGLEPGDAQRFHQIVHTEADRIAQTVEEMLELARLESGLAQPQRQRVNAAMALREAAERMLPQAERAGLTLTVVDPEEPLPVDADPDLVQRALINLLHNAVKFTPAPGAVSVSARREAEMVWLEVTDTGIGVSAEDQPRVFQRFYRADRARRRAGGTGLGLALVRHIAEVHGGGVRVSSRPGEGSTFAFSLPRHVP